MSIENRRAFLRSLITGSASVVAAPLVKTDAAPKIMTIEKEVVRERIVEKSIPENVNEEEMAIWLQITAHRRRKRI